VSWGIRSLTVPVVILSGTSAKDPGWKLASLPTEMLREYAQDDGSRVSAGGDDSGMTVYSRATNGAKLLLPALLMGRQVFGALVSAGPAQYAYHPLTPLPGSIMHWQRGQAILRFRHKRPRSPIFPRQIRGQSENPEDVNRAVADKIPSGKIGGVNAIFTRCRVP